MISSDMKQRLEKVGLNGVATDYVSFQTQQGSFEELLTMVVDVETKHRNLKSLERRKRVAKVGHFKHMVDFDWEHPEFIDQTRVEHALSLGFVEHGGNVILLGAQGLGKTMILQNIAHNAILEGKSVRFTTAAKLLGELGSIDSPSKLERRLRTYANYHLLCIDELGYLSYTGASADLLFEIITRRYNNRRPIALSTNLEFKKWGTIFPSATCTVALVDRLTHRADILLIKGESYRRREAKMRNAELER